MWGNLLLKIKVLLKWVDEFFAGKDVDDTIPKVEQVVEIVKPLEAEVIKKPTTKKPTTKKPADKTAPNKDSITGTGRKRQPKK